MFIKVQRTTGLACLGLAKLKLLAISLVPSLIKLSPSLIKLTKNFTVSRQNYPLNQMAPSRIEKKWTAKQLRHAVSLKTLVGIQKFQKAILEMLEDTKPRSVRQYPAKPIYSKITFAHKFLSR
jgi:hypothetical protein